MRLAVALLCFIATFDSSEPNRPQGIDEALLAERTSNEVLNDDVPRADADHPNEGTTVIVQRDSDGGGLPMTPPPFVSFQGSFGVLPPAPARSPDIRSFFPPASSARGSDSPVPHLLETAFEAESVLRLFGVREFFKRLVSFPASTTEPSIQWLGNGVNRPVLNDQVSQTCGPFLDRDPADLESACRKSLGIFLERWRPAMRADRGRLERVAKRMEVWHQWQEIVAEEDDEELSESTERRQGRRQKSRMQREIDKRKLECVIAMYRVAMDLEISNRADLTIFWRPIAWEVSRSTHRFMSRLVSENVEISSDLRVSIYRVIDSEEFRRETPDTLHSLAERFLAFPELLADLQRIMPFARSCPRLMILTAITRAWESTRGSNSLTLLSWLKTVAEGENRSAIDDLFLSGILLEVERNALPSDAFRIPTGSSGTLESATDQATPVSSSDARAELAGPSPRHGTGNFIFQQDEHDFGFVLEYPPYLSSAILRPRPPRGPPASAVRPVTTESIIAAVIGLPTGLVDSLKERLSLLWKDPVWVEEQISRFGTSNVVKELISIGLDRWSLPGVCGSGKRAKMCSKALGYLISAKIRPNGILVARMGAAAEQRARNESKNDFSLFVHHIASYLPKAKTQLIGLEDLCKSLLVDDSDELRAPSPEQPVEFVQSSAETMGTHDKGSIASSSSGVSSEGGSSVDESSASSCPVLHLELDEEFVFDRSLEFFAKFPGPNWPANENWLRIGSLDVEGGQRKWIQMISESVDMLLIRRLSEVEWLFIGKFVKYAFFVGEPVRWSLKTDLVAAFFFPRWSEHIFTDEYLTMSIAAFHKGYQSGEIPRPRDKLTIRNASSLVFSGKTGNLPEMVVQSGIRGWASITRPKYYWEEDFETGGDRLVVVLKRGAESVENALEAFAVFSDLENEVPIVFSFAGEAGLDGGGLRIEALVEISRFLFGSVKTGGVGLFETNSSGRLVITKAIRYHAKQRLVDRYMSLAGYILGLAIRSGISLNLVFSRIFYESLISTPRQDDKLALSEAEPEIAVKLSKLVERSSQKVPGDLAEPTVEALAYRAAVDPPIYAVQEILQFGQLGRQRLLRPGNINSETDWDEYADRVTAYWLANHEADRNLRESFSTFVHHQSMTVELVADRLKGMLEIPVEAWRAATIVEIVEVASVPQSNSASVESETVSDLEALEVVIAPGADSQGWIWRRGFGPQNPIFDLSDASPADVTAFDIEPQPGVQPAESQLASSEDMIDWFWENVGAMDESLKSKLLQFWTGNPFLPPDGFIALERQPRLKLLAIQDEYLGAHICVSELVVPRVHTKIELQNVIDRSLALALRFTAI